MPAEAVFIVGARTPLVNFYNSVGARPLWKTIPAGSAWPDDKLSNVIDGYLADGIPVYVDFDQSLWDPGARISRESPGLEMIRRDYQLDLARSPLLYQISRKEPAYPGSISRRGSSNFNHTFRVAFGTAPSKYRICNSRQL